MSQLISSDFELYTLLKQGRCCLISNTDSGLAWNIIALDYLLIQLLKQQEHIKRENINIGNETTNTVEIICLLCDRNEQDLKSSISFTDFQKKHADLHILNTYECSSLADIYKLIEKNSSTDKSVLVNRNHVDESNTNIRKNGNHTFNKLKKKYLFIYSLSELLLFYSFHDVMSFILKLEKELNFNYIIMNFHDTTHSLYNSTLNFNTPAIMYSTILNNLCNVICCLYTNDGTMSDEVCLQIHSFRRSLQTGKVTESVELFGYHNETFIYPLKQRIFMKDENNEIILNNNNTYENNDINNRHSNNSTAELLLTKALETFSINNQNIINNSLNLITTKKIDNINSSSTSTSSSSSSTTTITAAEVVTKLPNTVINTNNRLITFDSTDPEFDEDSDPDNDLDL